MEKTNLAYEIYGEILKMDTNTPESVVFRMIRKIFNLNRKVATDISKIGIKDISVEKILKILNDNKEIYFNEENREKKPQISVEKKPQTVEEKKPQTVVEKKPQNLFKESLKIDSNLKEENKVLKAENIDGIIKNELCFEGKTIYEWKKIKIQEGYQEDNIEYISNCIYKRINELKGKLMEKNNLLRYREDFSEFFSYVLSAPNDKYSMYNSSKSKTKRIWNESNGKKGKLSKIILQIFAEKPVSFVFIIASLEKDKFFFIESYDKYNYSIYNYKKKRAAENFSVLMEKEKEEKTF